MVKILRNKDTHEVYGIWEGDNIAVGLDDESIPTEAVELTSYVSKDELEAAIVAATSGASSYEQIGRQWIDAAENVSAEVAPEEPYEPTARELIQGLDVVRKNKGKPTTEGLTMEDLEDALNLL